VVLLGGQNQVEAQPHAQGLKALDAWLGERLWHRRHCLWNFANFTPPGKLASRSFRRGKAAGRGEGTLVGAKAEITKS
jgi:hypothetical protein